MMGGRTPKPFQTFPPIPGDSFLHGDVWKSSNLGRNWTQLASSAFPPRAYHESVIADGSIIMLGGQDYNLTLNPKFVFDPMSSQPWIGKTDDPPFFDNTKFFNDVWKTQDGISWDALGNAPWHPRAGLSAVTFRGDIYVLGGSSANDEVFNTNPRDRQYFNDVWKSSDGVGWIQLTDNAPWSPRAGPAVTVHNDNIYILGGEAGFTGYPPPFYNDVWKSSDGARWNLVTRNASWTPRPGHACHSVNGSIVCFGGYGQDSKPNRFRKSDPIDMWRSPDGANWELMSQTAWNAEGFQGKFDFDSAVVNADNQTAIYTFGGDRETFDFNDPTQWKNVDNDVWRFVIEEQESSNACKCGSNMMIFVVFVIILFWN